MLRQWQIQLLVVLMTMLVLPHATDNIFSSTIELTSAYASSTIGVDDPAHESIEWWMAYLYYIIGGAALCLCCVCVALAIHVRRRHRLQRGTKRLAQIQNEINERKKLDALEEQQPMTIGSPTLSATAVTGVAPPTTAPWSPTAMTRAYGFDGSAEEQLNLDDIDRLQQAQREMRTSTFTKPQHIAAFQALQFAPPINHDGRDGKWKKFDHTNSDKRMTQLMEQQQYVQQLANQAALAMNYFLEQQNRIQQQILDQQSSPSLGSVNQAQSVQTGEDVEAAPASPHRRGPGPPPRKPKPPSPPPMASNAQRNMPKAQRLESDGSNDGEFAAPKSSQFPHRLKKDDSVQLKNLPDLPFMSCNSDLALEQSDEALVEYDEDQY
mmetsp:Transcript_6501/g.10299  ORF Transcript_6501/g.10299 Transcript_6501/m.10299 type:complete len:380 (-) Transcript_6501:155-1294(-)